MKAFFLSYVSYHNPAIQLTANSDAVILIADEDRYFCCNSTGYCCMCQKYRWELIEGAVSANAKLQNIIVIVNMMALTEYVYLKIFLLKSDHDTKFSNQDCLVSCYFYY